MLRSPALSNELSEQRLAEQQAILRWLIFAVLGILAVVVVVGLVRGGRRALRGLPEELNRVIDRLVPPEVRAARPDARAVRGATPAERRLFRGQVALTLGACALPAAVGITYVRHGGPGDALSWVGEHLTIVLAVAAPLVVGWTWWRVKRAGHAGDARWAVLGLTTVQTPSFVLGPRGTGSARAVATGGLVLDGVRFGRRVRIDQRGGLGGLVQRTTVHGVGLPDGPLALGPTGGPGVVRAAVSAGTIVVERTIGRDQLFHPETPAAFVHDLAAAEAVSRAAGTRSPGRAPGPPG